MLQARTYPDWSEQHVIPVMREFPGANNAWAPEACYDRQNHEFRIFWSRTVPEAFPDHVNKPKDYRNHRIYSLYNPRFSVVFQIITLFRSGV